MAGMVSGLVKGVAAAYGIMNPVSVQASQVINSSRVSDHHAIIPTRTMQQMDPAELPSGEQAILRLVCTRLLVSSVKSTVMWKQWQPLTAQGVNLQPKGKWSWNRDGKVSSAET